MKNKVQRTTGVKVSQVQAPVYPVPGSMAHRTEFRAAASDMFSGALLAI